MRLFNIFKKKQTEIIHEEKDIFKCQKCKKMLAKKYMHKNNICAKCYNDSETKKVDSSKGAPKQLKSADMRLVEISEKKQTEIIHEEKDIFKCQKCKKMLAKKYMHKNNICAECYNGSETNKVNSPKVAPTPLKILREKIIESISKRPNNIYMVANVFGNEVEKAFPGDNRYCSANVWLDLKTMKFIARVSSYPSYYGEKQEQYYLTVAEFSQKARILHFSQEWLALKTEADLKALFNKELKSAIEKAEIILKEQKSKRAQAILDEVKVKKYMHNNNMCADCATISEANRESDRKEKLAKRQLEKQAKEKQVVKGAVVSTEKAKDTFICPKCKKKLAIKYIHKNNMCADCYRASETNKVNSRKVDEMTLNILRKKIIESINDRPDKTYQLASLLWKDAALCFPTGYSFDWDGAWFYLNLNTMELYADVSTYPNQFGACREERYSLSASEFHQKAIKFQFPIELQEMKTEADWKALFNDELKSAVDKAKKILKEQEEKQKEAERIAKAVVIPDDFKDRKPAMEFSEIWLELQQRYGWTKIVLIKESEKYILKYMSAHYRSCTRELSAIEASWLEQQVNDCMKNVDQTTWQSLPGGDMMTVKIYKNYKPTVELLNEKPLKKYCDLQDSLRNLVSYGSFTETEAKKIKG